MSIAPHFRRLHFSLKDRIVSFVSEKLFGDITYTARHGLIQGMKRKGGLGFLPAGILPKSHTQPEEDFLRGLDISGKVVYDIGTFQGMMTLFFARKAKAVIAYEPHPGNFRRLQENLNLNGLKNVTAFNRGLGDREGTILLACDPRMPGAATADPEIARQISASLTETQTIEMPVARLDDEIERHALPTPDLVKIDIEGMELPALLGMEKLLAARHPQIYLEMHGATEEEKEKKAAGILEFLARSGYTSVRHVESGASIASDNKSLARSGHLFCEAL